MRNTSTVLPAWLLLRGAAPCSMLCGAHREMQLLVLEMEQEENATTRTDNWTDAEGDYLFFWLGVCSQMFLLEFSILHVKGFFFIPVFNLITAALFPATQLIQSHPDNVQQQWAIRQKEPNSLQNHSVWQSARILPRLSSCKPTNRKPRLLISQELHAQKGYFSYHLLYRL